MFRIFVYQNHFFDTNIPTSLYFFSDGYQNQLGGLHHSRLSSRKFHQLLQQIATLPMVMQQEKLLSTFHEWLGHGREQIDDIMVIGIKL